MKKVAIVIAEEDFRDDELEGPLNALRGAGAEVQIVSSSTKEARGVKGMTIQPDMSIEEMTAEGLDGIILIGGPGAPDFLFADDKLFEVVNELDDKNKLVASICVAGAVLAQSGIMVGRAGTAYPDEDVIDAFDRNGATFINDQRVVIDDNVITGSGPEAVNEFTVAVLQALELENMVLS